MVGAFLSPALIHRDLQAVLDDNQSGALGAIQTLMVVLLHVQRSPAHEPALGC